MPLSDCELQPMILYLIHNELPDDVSLARRIEAESALHNLLWLTIFFIM